MSELTDKLDPMIQSYMLGAAICVACIMQMQLLYDIMPRERERLTEILGHEPTQEDWNDYWQFLGERNSNPKCLQRAIDREKIRHLLMGDNNGASKTK